MTRRRLLIVWLVVLGVLVSLASAQQSGIITWTAHPDGSVTVYGLEQLFPGIGGRTGPNAPAGPPGPVTIAPGAWPILTDNHVAQNFAVPVAGGTAPYTCAVTAGSLPTGITETAECLYGGTPTTPGTSAITITATDALLATDAEPYTITVLDDLVVITTTSWPSSLEDVPAPTVTISASGGTSPYTCAVTSGTLPVGITETSECNYGGTPTTPGTSAITITATDAVAATDTQTYSIVITAAAAIPAPWNNTDVGTGQAAGSASEAAGTWTVSGAGGTLGTADRNHSVYQLVTGDFEIWARVTACVNATTRRCGLFLRASSAPLSATAPNMFIGTQTDGTTVLRYRLTDSGTTSSVSCAAGDYKRIVNLAGQVSVYYGADGVSWTLCGAAQTLTLATYAVGLSVFTSDAQAAVLATMTLTTLTTDATPDPDTVDYGGYRSVFNGFGATSAGGRTGIVNRVTNLNDSGAGSLRTAVAARAGCVSTPATCARFVVFETSGTIALSSPIEITSPYLTVAGQTAPSPGINLRNRILIISTHNVVLQHFRIRHGSTFTGYDETALYIGNPSNPDNSGVHDVVLDHMSIAWGKATTLASTTQMQDILLVDSIISESLSSTNNPGGAANLWIGNTNGTATLARNLYVHFGNRGPWLGAGMRVAHYNNVVYNAYGVDANQWPQGPAQIVGGPTYPASIVELVSIGNIYIAGPNSGTAVPAWRIALASNQLPSQVYFSGNSGHGMTVADQWAAAGVWFCPGANCGFTNQANEGNTKITTRPSWYTAYNFAVTANTGTVIRDDVLNNAGARPTDRDSVDTRVVADVTQGDGLSGYGLTSETVVGGHPTLAVNSQTYTTPANPNNPGTCGTTTGGTVRTIIECDLETKAVALEP